MQARICKLKIVVPYQTHSQVNDTTFHTQKVTTFSEKMITSYGFWFTEKNNPSDIRGTNRNGIYLANDKLRTSVIKSHIRLLLLILSLRPNT